jgi:hypothetical protein
VFHVLYFFLNMLNFFNSVTNFHPTPTYPLHSSVIPNLTSFNFNKYDYMCWLQLTLYPLLRSVNCSVRHGQVGSVLKSRNNGWSKCHPIKKEVQLSFENIPMTELQQVQFKHTRECKRNRE